MTPARLHYSRKARYKDHQPDPNILRDCPVKKLKYDTKRIALSVAARALKLNGHVLYPYRCPHCRSWHLTKQEQTG